MAMWRVDIREPQELIKHFTDNYKAEVLQLDVGDYVYNDIVGYERKQNDFMNLTHTIRQAQELRVTYPYAFLVVETSLNQLIVNANKQFKKNMTNQILGSIASLCVRGTPPIFCSNQTYLLDLMNRIAIKATDGKERGLIPREIEGRKYDSISIGVSVLMGFPRIAEDRARAIISRFRTLREVLWIILNEPKKLLDVDGIGQGVLKSIEESLDKKSDEPEKIELF